MPPDATERSINRTMNLFGLRREARHPGDPLIVTEATTAWEIYNHKASEVDREMVKDWNDSLNTILIFLTWLRTALYSAILTAFIVESMKLLEEDPTETTRNILLVISRQLANASHPAFEQAAFKIPHYAIVVNGLFFTSLSCALIASLLAVLALQWVANYDMGLNMSSPRKRALQRHIRFRGVEKWKMPELIAGLPLLIFIALFLFFIGIADWLWHMNRGISSIVLGGIGIGSLLWPITNLISIVNVDAPFRTPVSKKLTGIMRQAMAWLQKTMIAPKSTPHGGNGLEQDAEYTMEQQLTFTQREENMFEGKDTIKLDGLLWLANNIEISKSVTNSFIALLKELAEVPALTLMDQEKLKDAPWKAIFEMLCTPYIGKKEYRTDELEVARWICKGMGIAPYFVSPICRRFLTVLRDLENRSIYSVVHFASYKQSPPLESTNYSINLLRLAFFGTKESIPHIEYNYLHFMILNAKKEWPCLEQGDRTRLVRSLAEPWTIPSAVIRIGPPSTVIPVNLLDLVLDFVVPHVGDTFEARYLAAIQGSRNHEWNDAIYQLFRMVAQQMVAQISHKINSLSGCTKELEFLARIMESKRQDLTKEMDDFVWVMIDRYKERYGYRELQRIRNTLCEGLFCRSFKLAWVDLILALDDFVTRLPPSSFHFYSQVVRFIDDFGSASRLEGSTDFGPLVHVRDPCIAWVISWLCPSHLQFQALIHTEFSKWNDIIEHEVVRLLNKDSDVLNTSFESDAQITFLRAIALDGPSNVRIGALSCLARGNWKQKADKWHQVFASPMLRLILEQSANSGGFTIHSLLRQLANDEWFYEEFSEANGLAWLPLIAQNDIYTEDQSLKENILTEILIDQILFSTANRNVQVSLLSSYHYLQSIGQTWTQIGDQSHRLPNLQAALIWVLNHSIKLHNSKILAASSFSLIDQPNLERYNWPTVGEVRSFSFIKDMSDEEWQEWVARLRVLIMGASLGGLKPGPLQNRGRFSRDTDGLCHFTPQCKQLSMENNTTKRPITFFGISREARYPKDSLVVSEDTTAWEIYNYKTGELDREFIKDCNDILTSFIVESMKLLKEDTSDVSRDILLIISRQLANNSFPPFEPIDHTIPSYAIVVNGLLFTSLLCALVAALLAVLALQWIASYDMGLNTTSA
ncbi:9391_t:CDS:2, partial [Acaulospora colombiana]